MSNRITKDEKCDATGDGRINTAGKQKAPTLVRAFLYFTFFGISFLNTTVLSNTCLLLSSGRQASTSLFYFLRYFVTEYNCVIKNVNQNRLCLINITRQYSFR